ncbi:S1 family peptidase [Streptomyces albireticuli]|nr:serine protease [Streptomyces albireticuli]MCD9144398.1 serine protease [Streptomyces albireticuli]MCD9163539.1 serine protease [Streptomyces albireticuli]MCD9193075.1 serine protease [Streptomyces albireticuli]
MGESTEVPVNDQVFEETWRVRISTPGGGMLGAGILLGVDTVLTCAHVIPWDGGPEPAGEVLVELVGVADATPVRARVAEGAWVPEQEDSRGDVALLRLAEPQHARHAAPLHRMAPSPGRTVRMFGHPDIPGLRDGVYFWATIDGPCGPRGEWVQLSPRTPAETVRPGFSGAAVTDVETHRVLGMVVSRYDDRTTDAPTGQRLHLSYMIPIETIVRHLPRIEEHVGGRRGNDLPSVPRGAPLDQDFARWLARWLRAADGGGRRGIEAIVIKKGEAARAATLSRAVALADREVTADCPPPVPAPAPRPSDHPAPHPSGHPPPAPRPSDRPPDRPPERLRPRRPDRSPGPPRTLRPPLPVDETVPPVGSVDLALDVSGETVAQVAERVADRLGLHTGDGATAVGRFGEIRTVPLTVVAEGVDYAEDPMALVEFTDLLAARGARLLLVFRNPESQSLELALRMADPSKDEITARLDRVHDRIEHIARRERAAHDRAALVAPVRTVPQEATGLRLDLTTLRCDPERGSRRFLPKLAAFESAVESGLLRVEEAIGLAEAGVARRDELRGRLEAFYALLATRSLEEERATAPLYRVAHNLLYQAPCELTEAERAVERFAEAVRRHTHRPRGGDRQ